MHKPWAGSERNHISELNTIQGGIANPYLSSSLPFCLRFNAELRLSSLITTLQNSIQGLWLGVTLAGAAPARLQTIASPHVHRLVRIRSSVRVGEVVRSIGSPVERRVNTAILF